MPQERQRRAASGSASAAHSNRVLIDTMREALGPTDVPVDAICAVPGLTHDSVMHLTRARGIVDVVIPRGGAGLIRNVVENSLVPVIETGVGNCHVYLHEDASVDRSVAIVVNSKTQRQCSQHGRGVVGPRSCSRAAVARGVRGLEGARRDHSRRRISEKYAQSTGISFRRATDLDWAEEYLSLDLAVRVVRDEQDAIDHITKWSSGHTGGDCDRFRGRCCALH